MAAAPAMANIKCEVDMGSDERINIAPTNTLDKPQRKLTSAGELPTPIGMRAHMDVFGGSVPLGLSPQSCAGPRRWRDQPYVILFIRYVSPLLLTTMNLPIKKTVRSIKQSSHVHSPFRIASTLLS
jgi:hypothetical protein